MGRRWSWAFLAAGCSAAMLLAGVADGPAASARGGVGVGSGGGTGGGGDISAWASYIHFSGPGYRPGLTGNSGISIDLPVCWYEKMTGITIQQLRNLWHHTGQETGWPPWPTDEHINDATGSFWTPTCAVENYPSDPASAAWMAAHWANFYLWVPNTDPTPPVTIDAKTLAKADVKVVQLPAITLQSSPDARAGTPSFVGLPTWLWAADWAAGTSVTATVPGMVVTVTAKPRVLLVDPGTTSARATVSTNAGPGQCKDLDHTAYTGDPTATPPCGVTYLHSTADVGSYQITTKVVWDLTYTENGVEQGPVPLGAEVTTAEPPFAVTVHEVQTPVSSG